MEIHPFISFWDFELFTWS